MAALCVLLAAACVYDYREKRIPNYLIVLTAFLGAGRRGWGTGPPGILFYIGQAVLVMMLLYPLFKIGGFGAGDVKLLGVTAGYLPFDKNLYFLFYSLLAAAVISLIKMWKENNFGARMRTLFRYLTDVTQNGGLKLYPCGDEEQRSGGVCLSGPILLSVLLYLGGAY